MKLKSLLFVLSFIFIGQTFATNQHMHPKANEVDNKKPLAAKSTMRPGYCEIEIKNNSYIYANVYGRFTDGAEMTPFQILPRDLDYSPHYISLVYFGYCHAGMYITITNAANNRIIYNNEYTTVYTTLQIDYYLKNDIKRNDAVEENITVNKIQK